MAIDNLRTLCYVHRKLAKFDELISIKVVEVGLFTLLSIYLVSGNVHDKYYRINSFRAYVQVFLRLLLQDSDVLWFVIRYVLRYINIPLKGTQIIE